MLVAMSFDVDGWVEISLVPVAEHGDGIGWDPLLCLSPLMLAGDRVSSELFGLAKEPASTAPFSSRGLPADACSVVRAAFDSNEAFIAKYGEGAFGHTHALWSEIISRDLSELLSGSEWDAVFRMIQCLPAHLLATPEQVRLVVWGTW